MTSEQEPAMYDQPSGVPGFAERERGAASAWESFSRSGTSMSHDFRGGYHQGVIDQARRQPASEAHAPTECADCDVPQVLAWIDKTLKLPVYQEPFSEIAEGVVATLRTVRKMLDGTSRPDASWRTVQGEPSDAQADAAQIAFHEYILGEEEPLTQRELGFTRQAWRVALKAAAAVQGGETR